MAKHTHYDGYRPHHRIKLSADAGQTTHQATVGVEVVYYLLLPDGNIKIGTSSNALERMAKHRRTSGYQEVLAIEFGGAELERQRHQEFAHLRVSRAENFLPSPELINHIDALRQSLGITA